MSKLSVLQRLADYMATLAPETFAKGNMPEQMSSQAMSILQRLKALSPTKELGTEIQRNIAAQVDDLGLDILGFRGVRETDPRVLQAPRLGYNKRYGDHVDIQPGSRVAEGFAGGYSNRPGLNIPVLFGGRGGLGSDAAVEYRPQFFDNLDFALYPNSIEGRGARAVEKREPGLASWTGARSLENSLILNPSAVVLNPEKIRFALEAEGKPGIGYRKAKGGLVQMKECGCK